MERKQRIWQKSRADMSVDKSGLREVYRSYLLTGFSSSHHKLIMSTSNSKYCLRMCILQNDVNKISDAAKHKLAGSIQCQVETPHLRLWPLLRQLFIWGIFSIQCFPQNRQKYFSFNSFNHLVTHQIDPWTLFAGRNYYSKSKAKLTTQDSCACCCWLITSSGRLIIYIFLTAYVLYAN